VARWVVPKLWPGATVAILGGGPSLIGQDLCYDLEALLSPFRIIGVNNSYRFGPWVDVCWFGDSNWYKQHHYELRTFPGLKICCQPQLEDDPGARAEGIKVIARGQPEGLERRKGYVCWNRSSGASAINLAVIFGAKRIILLGFDMRVINGTKNWHKDHRSQDHDPFERFLQPFPAIKRDAEKMKVEILNATPDSGLKDLFPYVTLSEIAKWAKP